MQTSRKRPKGASRAAREAEAAAQKKQAQALLRAISADQLYVQSGDTASSGDFLEAEAVHGLGSAQGSFRDYSTHQERLDHLIGRLDNAKGTSERFASSAAAVNSLGVDDPSLGEVPESGDPDKTLFYARGSFRAMVEGRRDQSMVSSTDDVEAANSTATAPVAMEISFERGSASRRSSSNFTIGSFTARQEGPPADVVEGRWTCCHVELYGRKCVAREPSEHTRAAAKCANCGVIYDTKKNGHQECFYHAGDISHYNEYGFAVWGCCGAIGVKDTKYQSFDSTKPDRTLRHTRQGCRISAHQPLYRSETQCALCGQEVFSGDRRRSGGKVPPCEFHRGNWCPFTKTRRLVKSKQSPAAAGKENLEAPTTVHSKYYGPPKTPPAPPKGAKARLVEVDPRPVPSDTRVSADFLYPKNASPGGKSRMYMSRGVFQEPFSTSRHTTSRTPGDVIIGMWTCCRSSIYQGSECIRRRTHPPDRSLRRCIICDAKYLEAKNPPLLQHHKELEPVLVNDLGAVEWRCCGAPGLEGSKYTTHESRAARGRIFNHRYGCMKEKHYPKYMPERACPTCGSENGDDVCCPACLCTLCGRPYGDQVDGYEFSRERTEEDALALEQSYRGEGASRRSRARSTQMSLGTMGSGGESTALMDAIYQSSWSADPFDEIPSQKKTIQSKEERLAAALALLPLQDGRATEELTHDFTVSNATLSNPTRAPSTAEESLSLSIGSITTGILAGVERVTIDGETYEILEPTEDEVYPPVTDTVRDNYACRYHPGVWCPLIKLRLVTHAQPTVPPAPLQSKVSVHLRHDGKMPPMENYEVEWPLPYPLAPPKLAEVHLPLRKIAKGTPQQHHAVRFLGMPPPAPSGFQRPTISGRAPTVNPPEVREVTRIHAPHLPRRCHAIVRRWPGPDIDAGFGKFKHPIVTPLGPPIPIQPRVSIQPHTRKIERARPKYNAPFPWPAKSPPCPNEPIIPGRLAPKTFVKIREKKARPYPVAPEPPNQACVTDDSQQAKPNDRLRSGGRKLPIPVPPDVPEVLLRALLQRRFDNSPDAVMKEPIPSGTARSCEPPEKAFMHKQVVDHDRSFPILEELCAMRYAPPPSEKSIEGFRKQGKPLIPMALQPHEPLQIIEMHPGKVMKKVQVWPKLPVPRAHNFPVCDFGCLRRVYDKSAESSRMIGGVTQRTRPVWNRRFGVDDKDEKENSKNSLIMSSVQDTKVRVRHMLAPVKMHWEEGTVNRNRTRKLLNMIPQQSWFHSSDGKLVDSNSSKKLLPSSYGRQHYGLDHAYVEQEMYSHKDMTGSLYYDHDRNQLSMNATTTSRTRNSKIRKSPRRSVSKVASDVSLIPSFISSKVDSDLRLSAFLDESDYQENNENAFLQNIALATHLADSSDHREKPFLSNVEEMLKEEWRPEEPLDNNNVRANTSSTSMENHDSIDRKSSTTVSTSESVELPSMSPKEKDEERVRRRKRWEDEAIQLQTIMEEQLLFEAAELENSLEVRLKEKTSKVKKILDESKQRPRMAVLAMQVDPSSLTYH